MQLLTLPPSPALATSIRATAQVFEDPKSKALLDHIQQVAPSEASVLIIGETGTGKEVVARAIHRHGRRAAQGFEAVFAFDNRGYVQRKGFSVTANLLARREIYRRIGGFRTGLSEDKDWCHRATAADINQAAQVVLVKAGRSQQINHHGGNVAPVRDAPGRDLAPGKFAVPARHDDQRGPGVQP